MQLRPIDAFEDNNKRKATSFLSTQFSSDKQVLEWLNLNAKAAPLAESSASAASGQRWPQAAAAADRCSRAALERACEAGHFSTAMWLVSERSAEVCSAAWRVDSVGYGCFPGLLAFDGACSKVSAPPHHSWVIVDRRRNERRSGINASTTKSKNSTTAPTAPTANPSSPYLTICNNTQQ